MAETPSAFHLAPGDALLIVDVQNDFLPGGSLAVPEGDRVIPPLNRCAALFDRLGLPVIATRDWHPRDHCSFREQGGPWPAHCIAGTPGAAFPETLQLPANTLIVSKATHASQEAYSGFQGTGLESRLREAGVERLFIGGLATDYCVLETVRDALRAGFRVVLLGDAVRAVDVRPGDGERALQEMLGAGARLARCEELTA
ncbi:nicotinamidase [Thiohalobacter sp. IOR34]|uniref:nicotinamidase n=1 Tax=Thiohalobacter sp. IOR34 TaxID=3057176 RepID=UPI0025B27358|nr:nicotinamidase [Thiohalobacter sp. IOR34]WJW76564.1 nicotinamidase [Thiohalobacter sp. IOR34]